jgi:hypothetical protein
VGDFRSPDIMRFGIARGRDRPGGGGAGRGHGRPALGQPRLPRTGRGHLRRSDLPSVLQPGPRARRCMWCKTEPSGVAGVVPRALAAVATLKRRAVPRLRPASGGSR